MRKFRVRKGDKIKVISGRDKGKEGEVVRTFPLSGRVLVSGVNLVKKHLKAREGQSGGIVDVERPVALSKTALVCQTCQKSVRVGFKIDGSRKVRICKSCQSEL